jgi:hypothetical protein
MVKQLVYWLTEDIREMAVNCIRARHSEKNPGLHLAIDPEVLLAITEALENAGVEFVGTLGDGEAGSPQMELFDEEDYRPAEDDVQ